MDFMLSDAFLEWENVEDGRFLCCWNALIVKDDASEEIICSFCWIGWIVGWGRCKRGMVVTVKEEGGRIIMCSRVALADEVVVECKTGKGTW